MKQYIIAVALLTIIFMSGCGAHPTGHVTAEEDTIKIGAIFMLTGLGSFQGQSSLQGAQMAVDEINAAGGVLGKQLELVAEDNMGDNPKVAISAYNKLKFEGIDVIIGPNWSPSGVALAPLACEEDTVLISPSLGIDSFHKTCDRVFNFWGSDVPKGMLLGNKVIEHGYDNVVVIGSQQNWEFEQAHAAKAGIEELGGTVLDVLITSREDRDFRAEVLKVLELQPEAIVLTNYGYQYLTAKRLREAGVDVPLFAAILEENHIESADGAFEGTIAYAPSTPTEEFKKGFEIYSGEPAGMTADTSYDVVMLFVEAIKATGSAEAEDIRTYLNSVTEFEGASGYHTFDEFGGSLKKPSFYKVQEGQRVALS